MIVFVLSETYLIEFRLPNGRRVAGRAAIAMTMICLTWNISTSIKPVSRLDPEFDPVYENYAVVLLNHNPPCQNSRDLFPGLSQRSKRHEQ